MDESCRAGSEPECDCVENAWRAHGKQLRWFLRRRTADPAVAEDLLQDVFAQAAGQGIGFCRLDDARAWLFRVARNRLVDHVRRRRLVEPLDEATLQAETDDETPLYALEHCLRRSLARLESAERGIIEACDLRRMPQAEYAAAHGLSLSATKSRLLRARRKLRRLLVARCRVRFDDTGRVSDLESPTSC
jgi:RNA polymerase sigma-70 factor (ECF subfamily)